MPDSQAAHARLAYSWVQACSRVPGLQPAEPKHPGAGDPDFTHDEWRGMHVPGLAATWASGL